MNVLQIYRYAKKVLVKNLLKGLKVFNKKFQLNKFVKEYDKKVIFFFDMKKSVIEQIK